MKEAASNPNMHAKISGLGTTVGKGYSWQKEDLLPYISFVLEFLLSSKRLRLPGVFAVVTGRYPCWQAVTSEPGRLTGTL